MISQTLRAAGSRSKTTRMSSLTTSNIRLAGSTQMPVTVNTNRLVGPPPRVLIEFVVDAVDQSLPTRLDYVVRNANSTPTGFAVARLDQNSHRSCGSLSGGQHPDFIIQQLNILETGVKLCQC